MNQIEIKISNEEINYKEAVLFMESKVKDISENHSKELIWFLIHNHIFTQGTSASDDEILNSEGLRNDKEFVNHKILDCIGDLYTSGYRIVASIKCSQGGHYLTNQLLREVFRDKQNFSILEIKEKNLPHTLINKNLLRSIA